MSIKFSNYKSFNKLIGKACKGTTVTTKELLRELVDNGYQNFKELDLTLEDLKMIVSDIADSKEISALYTHTTSTRSEVEVQD